VDYSQRIQANSYTRTQRTKTNLPVTAVPIAAFNLIKSCVRPVELAFGPVNGKAVGRLYVCADDGLYVVTPTDRPTEWTPACRASWSSTYVCNVTNNNVTVNNITDNNVTVNNVLRYVVRCNPHTELASIGDIYTH
jgi:hypothetical protein